MNYERWLARYCRRTARCNEGQMTAQKDSAPNEEIHKSAVPQAQAQALIGVPSRRAHRTVAAAGRAQTAADKLDLPGRFDSAAFAHAARMEPWQTPFRDRRDFAAAPCSGPAT
jgi:hypothetical protein